MHRLIPVRVPLTRAWFRPRKCTEVSRVNYFGPDRFSRRCSDRRIAFIYAPVGWKMLPRTADIIQGFCISRSEISSTTRNLLFRPATVAQICGLFRDASSSFSRWKFTLDFSSLFFSSSPSPLSFSLLFLSFLLSSVSLLPSRFFFFFHSVPIVDASWHTFIIHDRWLHRNRGLRAEGKSTKPAPPLFVLSRVLLNTSRRRVDETHSKGGQSSPSPPAFVPGTFGKYLNAAAEENERANGWLLELPAAALHYRDL